MIPLAPAPVEPADHVSRLSQVAYGFMGSAALFAALDLDLFTRLAGGPRPLTALAADTGVAPGRPATLLSALTGLGLLLEEPGACYRNAPAGDRYLVQGAAEFFGDYYRLQIARQIYPAMGRLTAGLTAPTPGGMTGLLSDPEEARTFSIAQHAGSLGPARVLARRLDLTGASRMLDVGGGTGAFSVALCRRHPQLRAAILDLPLVVAAAQPYLAAAGLGDRVELLPGEAVTSPWPGARDVVMMSYLLSAVDYGDVDRLLVKAHECLRPGGLLVVHDFMLHDDAVGPALAALWFLPYLAFGLDTRSFTASGLAARMRDHGFVVDRAETLIPEITTVVTCRRVVPS